MWKLAAVFALVSAMPWLLRHGRRLDARLRPWLRELIPAALLAGATTWIYRGLAKGIPPTTYDNNYHLLKAIETARLLHSGRLFGWSDMEFAGFPHNLQYPFLGSLLTVMLHGFPGVTLQRAYAWSIFLCVLAMVAAVYFAARLHFGRWTALVAGAFALLDPGSWWVGGHSTTVHIGMWVQTFSTAGLLASLALWPAALLRKSDRALVAAGLLIGVAVLFHPQALVLLAAFAIPGVLAMASAAPGRVRSVLARLVALGGIAFTVCAFWLVPYVGLRNAQRLYQFEPPGAEYLWAHFIDGTLFFQPALWMGASFCGVLYLAQRREPFARFIALSVPAVMVLFAKETLEWLHLRPQGHPGFVDDLQLLRLFFLIRPLGMIAAAVAVAGPGMRALERIGGRGPRWTRVATQLFVAFVFTALARFPLTLPGAPNDPDPQGFKGLDPVQYDQALQAAAPLVGPDGRLALYHENQFEHGMVGPASLDGFKQLKIGAEAAILFSSRFTSGDTETLARSGVRALISHGAPPPVLRDLPLVARFGAFEVHRVEPEPRAWIEGGPGQVEVLRFTEEEIALRVTGSDPAHSRVVLGLGYFDRWRTADGTPVTLYRFHGAPFSSLPAHDGELVIRYVPPPSQWVGLALSLLGVLVIAAWPFIERRWRKTRPLAPTLQPAVATPAEPAPPERAHG